MTNIPNVYIPCDLESYPNIYVIKFWANGLKFKFECSTRINEWSEFANFISKISRPHIWVTGYNFHYYDYPVIHHLMHNVVQGMTGAEIAKMAYDRTVHLIEDTPFEKRHNSVIRKNRIFQYIDLQQVNDYGGRVSLKKIGFNYQRPLVDPLPFPPGTILTHDEMDRLLAYHDEDMEITEQFTQDNLRNGMIEGLHAISAETGVDCHNMHGTAVSKTLLLHYLGEKACYNGTGWQRKPKQTRLNGVIIGPLLHNYVQFNTDNLKRLKAWLSVQVVKVSVLPDGKSSIQRLQTLDYSPIEDLMGRVYTVTDKKQLHMVKIINDRWAKGITDYPEIDQNNPLEKGTMAFCKRYIEALLNDTAEQFVPKGKITKFSINVYGDPYTLGLGGIHMSRDNAGYVPPDDKVILDIDVGGMYVEIIRQNGIHPKHIPLEIWGPAFGTIPERRAQWNKHGSILERAMNTRIKLAGNSVYGLSQERHSSFVYDPSMTLETTLNGQLATLMLIEALHVGLTDLTMIQANTDGITFSVLRNEASKARLIWEEWEKKTNLVMEATMYKRLYMLNVNHYLAEDYKGKIKAKGPFAHKNLTHDQAWNELVVRNIGQQILLGTLTKSQILETLMNWENDYDFFRAVQVDRSTELFAIDEAGTYHPLPKFIRVAVTKTGVRLMTRRMKTESQLANSTDGVMTKDISILAGMTVVDCSDYSNFDRAQLDYSYYVAEVERIINIQPYQI